MGDACPTRTQRAHAVGCPAREGDLPVTTVEETIMADATAKFFADLAHHAHYPMLEKASGSLRFEIADGKAVERWRVEVRKGEFAVSRKAGAADCVLRASKPLFDKLASGRENAMAAVLRGALVVDGDLDLVVAFQRILPSPPRRGTTPPSTSRQRTRKGESR